MTKGNKWRWTQQRKKYRIFVIPRFIHSLFKVLWNFIAFCVCWSPSLSSLCYILSLWHHLHNSFPQKTCTNTHHYRGEGIAIQTIARIKHRKCHSTLKLITLSILFSILSSGECVGGRRRERESKRKRKKVSSVEIRNLFQALAPMNANLNNSVYFQIQVQASKFDNLW